MTSTVTVVDEDLKTYWDFSEKERAQMTQEQVEDLLDLELMTKGVMKVIPPTLEKEVELPNLEEVQMVKVGEYAFDDLEKARAFLALKPRRLNYEYLGGDWSNRMNYAEPFKLDSAEVVVLKRYEDIMQYKSLLEKSKGILDRNKKLTEQFKKDSDAQARVFDGVWSDWSAQRQKIEIHQRVMNTYENYIALSGGNAVTAARFLFKAIAPNSVYEAYSFMGLPLPEGIQIVKDETEKATS